MQNNNILAQMNQKLNQQQGDIQSNLDQSTQPTSGSQGNGFITLDQMNQDQAPQGQPEQSQPAPVTNANGTAADGNDGNWFTKALPTIGSIAAPLLGALLAPATGGASLLAGLALAGGGNAAGKLGENALEGKKDLTSGVAQSALEGAGGQLVGGVLGKGIGAAGKAISGIADKGIASAATNAAAGAATDASKTANAIYGQVPKYLQGKIGMTQQLANEAGVPFHDPNAVVGTAKTALNTIGGLRNDIIGQSGKIPVMGAVDAAGNKVAPSVDDLIKSSLLNKNPTTGEQLGLAHTSALGDLGPRGSEELAKDYASSRFVGSMAKGQQSNGSTQFLNDANSILKGVMSKGEADPSAFMNAQQMVGKKAAQASLQAGKDGAGPELQANADAWNALNGHLKDMMFNRDSVNSAVSALPGNLRAADVGGNQMLADALNSKLGGAQTGQDLNTALSDYIGMRKVGQSGLDVVNNPASTGTLKLNKMNEPISMGGEQGIPTSKAGLVTSLIKNVGGAVGNGGQTSQVASKLGNALSGSSAIANKIASRMPEGATANIAGNYATNAGLLGTLGVQSVMGTPNFQGPAGQGSVISDLNINQPQAGGDPIEQILSSNAPGSAAAKLAVMTAMNTPTWDGGGANALKGNTDITAFSNNQQNLANTGSQVNDYIHALNAAGGGQGAIGGLLAQLGGQITGGPAKAVDMQRQQLEASLAQAFGHPVSLPGLTSTQGTANSVLANLGTRLNTQSGF